MATPTTERRLAIAALLAATVAPLHAASPLVAIEAMTSAELRDRVAAGTTTVLFPVGGTEQNGAHMALGKHNVRVRVLAERIARELGDALVAPVLAYVPEGRIDPPSGHMRFPGTISIPESAFEATLVAAAQSLRRHGLCDLYFLGDHGGYRTSLDRAAAVLNKADGKGSGARCRASSLPAYYKAASVDFDARLRQAGHAAAEIGTHAGLADTALALAVDPALVRSDLSAARPDADGVAGDPRRATAALGQPGIDHIVEASVAAIRAARLSRPTAPAAAAAAARSPEPRP